ncbi:3-hydroxyacyl-CoA dehydrogenase family protein [Alicyclobacillus fastidiosus]|uniref:3-hydroxyacyl-CoA dehydrogenase NAD-binding domain-containing protein n=1 Tax=Alicyclobacillus fastidiosus TaxID=392011 RepID=A0ABV5ACY6_9BACL|nr:3-hydroxyacyl-CoA dehydrogenase NAD-binding domain-containing protein [Alicyclobacillus fastidiosus]WEH11251.1 3-hydroxyacyl-CoA dehydrogenase NAD-binding domain-containing protein [Alicyclobacillus fastidiosus]
MEVTSIGVVGAGLMGRGIAQVAAMKGYDVYLYDVDPAVVDNALFQIGQRLASEARKARISQDESELAIRRIRACTDLSDFVGVHLVIEAVPEKMEHKQAVFRRLSSICSPRTIFATNTSGLSITEMASVTDRPESFLGMHFFHPVPVMKLVEIIRGSETEEEAVDAAKTVCERLGKRVIEVGESPLFVVNRILVPMLNEAIFALQEGLATPEDIDTGMMLGANHPIGPLALADMVGLDTLLDTSLTLLSETGDTKYRPPQLLRQMVRAGKLGRKSGVGFYDYRD